MAKLQLLLLLFLFSFAAAPSMTGVVGINLSGLIRRLFPKRPFKPKPSLPNLPPPRSSPPPTNTPSSPPPPSNAPSSPPPPSNTPSSPPPPSNAPSSPPPPSNAPSSPPPPSNAPSTDVQTLLYSGDSTFLMELAIGTPSLSYTAIMSTSSDLIWTQCLPCLQCFSQPTSLYDPSGSSTYASYCDPSAADCSYYYGYGDTFFTQGFLGVETFTFGSAVVPGIAFGCGNNNSGNFDNSSGVVGMGRGSWSLVSQLGYGRFSYCLTPFGDTNTSPLLLGDMATLTAQAQSTPFVPNPPSWPSLYYLSLQGITVGETELPIPSTTFSIAADGTGGMIIDSSSTLTMLVDPAYSELKGAFESQINLPVADGSAYGLDICFEYAGENVTGLVPGLVFHFEGADMELPLDNYIAANSSVGLLCVVVVASSDLSIFGNYMQQNMHVLYDLVGETLSFEAAQCDQL